MLEKFRLLQTNNVEQAEAALIGAGATSFKATPSSSFFFTTNLLRMKQSALIDVAISTPGSVAFPEASFVRHYFPIAGGGRLSTEGGQHTLSRKTAGFVVPPDRSGKYEGGANNDTLILRTELGVLENKLSALIGEPCEGKLKFEAGEPPNNEHSRLFRQSVLQLAYEANQFGSEWAEIACHEIEQSVLMRTLIFSTHNFSHVLHRKPSSLSRTRTDAVEDYIRENWDKAIDIESLAVVAGTSVRSLFRHFRQARACSPSEYIKSVRLQRARELLGANVPGSTVTQIAYKCGFLSLGHFSQAYYRAFGEYPNHTLRHTNW